MFGHYERVFPLCTWQLVFSYNSPVIVFVYKHFPRAEVYHRFNSKYHSWYQYHTSATPAIVVNVWFFVEL